MTLAGRGRPARRTAALLLALLSGLAALPAGARAEDEELGTDEQAGVPTFEDAEIEFAGNGNIWGFTLGIAMSDFDRRLLSAASVDDAAFSLERYYAGRGFPFTKVAGTLTKDKEGRPVIRFTIDEGPQPRVASVDIVGNRALETDLLQKALEVGVDHWYDPSYVVIDDLDSDQSRLKNLYTTHGYVEAEVGYNVAYGPGRTAAHILWVIEEGRHFTVAAIEIAGNRAFDQAALVSATGIPIGADYYPARALQARDAVESHYHDRGYAFAAARAEPVVDEARATARLEVQVVEGAKWNFGQVSVHGNETTKTSIIEREFRFEPGEPYDHAKIRAAERRLYELGLFDRVSVKVTPSKTAPKEADVMVEVHEPPAGSIRLGVGYGSFDMVRGQVGLGYANLFGRGIEGDVRATVSVRGYELGAGLHDPFTLGTKLRFDLDLFYEDRDVKVFYIRRQGGTAFLSYPLIPKPARLLLSPGVRLEHSKVTSVETGALVEQSTIDLVSTIVRLSLDTRDDPLNPKWGTYHEVSYEEAGIMDLGTADFSKVLASASYFVTPTRRLTIGLGLRGGVIFEHRGQEVPLQERFFLGGDRSLRGFSLNEVGSPNGGNAFVLGSVESVFLVLGPLGVAVFVDAGNVYPTYKDVTLRNVRVTPGFGLRVGTPIGPLRLEFGFVADRRSGESLMQVQFAVGSPF